MEPFEAVMTRIRAARVDGEPFRTLDEATVAEAEREIGFPLPADYRAFVRRYGLAAGTGDVKFRNVDNEEELETSVDVFHQIRRGARQDLAGTKRAFEDFLPAHLLPIATGSGGHFCLSLHGNDIGCIYWWSPHSASLDPADDFELVGRDFSSFVNSLTLVATDE